MKRKQCAGLSRDELVEVQRCGAFASDERTLEPASYLGHGCRTTLTATTQAIGTKTCTSTYRIQGSGDAVSFTVKHFVDADSAKETTQGAASDGHADETGLCLWPVSFLLMEWLASRERELGNASVLELGAGCGLVGLAASSIGAAFTKITDGSEAAIRLVAENIKANALQDRAKSQMLRWGEAHAAAEQKFDIVIACEVAHVDLPVIDLLFETASASLRDGESVFVVGYLVRGPSGLGSFGAKRLVEAGAQHGLAASLLDVDHLDRSNQPPCYRSELIVFRRKGELDQSKETVRFLDALGDAHLTALIEDDTEDEEEREKRDKAGQGTQKVRKTEPSMQLAASFSTIFEAPPGPSSTSPAGTGGFRFGF